MKTLPKKIHYSGFDYEVIEVERLDGRETWGRTSFESQTIHIEKGISFQRKMQTLIHEILHIAYHHTSNVLDDKTIITLKMLVFLNSGNLFNHSAIVANRKVFK